MTALLHPSERPAPSTASSPRPHAASITRRVRFSAAHFYHLPQWSDEENRKRFHGCSNRNGHGHNYGVDVTVTGPIDPETGMVMNLKDLKELLDDIVVRPLAHKNLNLEVPWFENRLPTLENITRFIWDRVSAALNAENIHLTALRVEENEFLYAEYFGEHAENFSGEKHAS